MTRRVPTTLTLPAELVERLDQAAAADGRSRSGMAARAIREFLDHQDSGVRSPAAPRMPGGSPGDPVPAGVVSRFGALAGRDLLRVDADTFLTANAARGEEYLRRQLRRPYTEDTDHGR